MKKGFVFIETLIVLIVLLITVVGIYGTYIKISSDIESRKIFDNIGDLYKTDTIRSTFTTNNFTNSNGYLEITPSNCNSYMSTTCQTLMSSLNTQKIYINIDSINSLLLSSENNLPNSLKEYLRTINNNKNERYIIVNYKYNDKNYYASLRI